MSQGEYAGPMFVRLIVSSVSQLTIPAALKGAHTLT